MIFGEGPIIKNIAGDLNKLFLQGSRAGQPVNVEGSAAANQGTAALMADRDPVIRDISTGLGYAGREVTVSGTGALQLVNSLGRPLKSWSVELAPYQEGSGDPSPENVRRIYGTNKLKLFVEESYDPSATPKAIINLPQTVYTGTIGSEGEESRDVAIDMGSLSWSVWVNDMHTFVTRLPQSNSAKQQLTCESYKPLINGSTQWGAILSYDMVVYKPLGDVYLMCRNTNYSDTESFKQSVQGVKLVYPLATPTTFTLTAPTIPTPTGSATTWATAEDGIITNFSATYLQGE